MNRISKYIVEHSLLTVLLASLVAGWLSSSVAVGYRVDERSTLLETEAQRCSLEVMSQTLNGNLMGSMAMFGLTDADIKSEALGKQTSMSQKLLGAFESIGLSYDAQGVFLVPRDGVITLSWDSAGKPSTGLNVKFRPYFQMAMKGRNNVYAAVSLARGDRALYFSAPVYQGSNSASESIGAIVARTTLQKVDELLRGKADIALLLSPQGVVFASSRKEWIGHLSGAPTPERLNAIRELKQFGNLFEKSNPPVLPMSAEPGIRKLAGRSYIVASAKVQWNDPMGDWSLVLMEDLARTVPLTDRLLYGLSGSMVVLFIGLVLVRLLRSRHAQQQAGEQLAAYSSEQQRAAERKTMLSEAGLQMQQAQQIDELVRTYFNAAHRMFGGLQGVAYRVEQTKPERMTLAGSYACAEAPQTDLAMGEGLLGQCAVEKRSQIIDTDASGFATIRSGLGETVPAALLLAPIMLHDRLLGVVELALLHKPENAEQELFEELTGLLAMNIEIIDRSTRAQSLLAEKQEQAQKLEQQHAALQDSFLKRDEANKALESQVEELARTRNAMMNIMEDIEHSKKEIEERNAQTESLLEESKQQMDELERFNRLTINREEKMIELKMEINALLAEMKKEKKYKIVE